MMLLKWLLWHLSQRSRSVACRVFCSWQIPRLCVHLGLWRTISFSCVGKLLVYGLLLPLHPLRLPLHLQTLLRQFLPQFHLNLSPVIAHPRLNILL